MTSSPRLGGDGEGLSDEMVRAALDAHFRAQYYAKTPEDNVPGYGPMRRALVSAGVPDLIAERDRAVVELRQLRRRVLDADRIGAAFQSGGSSEWALGAARAAGQIREALRPSDNAED